MIFQIEVKKPDDCDLGIGHHIQKYVILLPLDVSCSTLSLLKLTINRSQDFLKKVNSMASYRRLDALHSNLINM